MIKISLRRWITWYLAAAMLIIGITPRAFAGFSPSEAFVLTPGERSADLEKIQKFLEMKMVRERLKDLGYTADEIQGKLRDLNDQQIHQLATKMDDLSVGGDGLGIIIAILVIVILVILIIQLTGHRVVVK